MHSLAVILQGEQKKKKRITGHLEHTLLDQARHIILVCSLEQLQHLPPTCHHELASHMPS